MQKLVFINGAGDQIDLTSIADNFGIVNWEGLSNTDLNIQSQQVPFEDGGVFLDALMEQREIAVTVAIQDNGNLELRYQKKRELISALNPKAGEGVLIYTNNYLSKQIKAVPQIPLFENKNSNDAGTLKASIAFTCCNPYWEDLEETQVYLNGGEQSNVVNNDGDGFIGAKISIFANQADNITLANLTENKKIIINGELTGTININTQLGEKSVLKKMKPSYEDVSFSHDIYDICYAEDKGLFCCACAGGVDFSKDGVDWEFVAINATLYGICYSKKLGKFVAVGSGGVIYTSEDCTEWESQGQESNTIYSVIYSEELEIFIAVGFSIITSSDGITWTTRASSLHPNVMTDICYSKKLGIFVAVGMNNTVGKSADAITWTFTSGASLMENFSVTYSESLELFCLASYAGTVKTSADGDTWVSKTIPISSNWYRVRFLNDKFVIVGKNGTIVISTDGNTWKNTAVSESSSYIVQSYLKGVCFAKNLGIYITAGDRGGKAQSINGSRWDYITFNISSGSDFYDIAFNYEKNIYLAGGNNGHLLRSLDGKKWEYYVYNTNRNIVRIIYSEKYKCFVAIMSHVTSDISYILTSPDGIAWTSKYQTSYLNSICYSEKLKLFCACGNNGKIITSTDLNSWTERTSGVSVRLSDVIYENDIFLICGASNTILKSIDGINWENISVSTGDYRFYAIKYLKPFNKYIIAGNTIGISSDLEEWVFNDTLNTVFYAIEYYAEEGYVILGGNKTYKSTDLDSWDEITKFNTMLNNLKTIDDVLWLCGRNAMLVKTITGENENIISSLDSNSDMALGLEIGNNKLLITSDSGTVRGVITYRQKYIGV